MKNPFAEVHDERLMQKKLPIIYFFSDVFGLRSPVIQKTFQTKNATSIVPYYATVPYRATVG